MYKYDLICMNYINIIIDYNNCVKIFIMHIVLNILILKEKILIIYYK